MTDPRPERSLTPRAVDPGIESARRRARGLLGEVVRYEPRPLEPPRVDEDFDRMTRAGRTLEALRYGLSLLEHAAASSGWLRAWLVLWLRLAWLTAVPAAAAGLIVLLLTPMAAGLAELAASAEQAAASTFHALAWLAGCGALGAVVIHVIRSLMDRG